jgi:site-specific DNA-methyltransferase (adenine-specific)
VAEVLAGEARFAVVCGDAVEVLPTIGNGTVAAVVTDPPSGIAFMGAEWDRDKGGRTQWVAWLADILADARRCTRDGGRSVVWSLPRTSHWTGCAVEDAGWSIETRGVHLFSNGWPKAKSQLKPSCEDWWFARNGASTPLNVDSCRVAASGATDAALVGSVAGRYPPNVTVAHTAACRIVGTAKILSHGQRHHTVQHANSAVGYSGGSTKRDAKRSHKSNVDADGMETIDLWECADGCVARHLATMPDYGGESPARYYPQFAAEVAESPVLYCGRATEDERVAGIASGSPRHISQKPLALMRWLIDLVTQRGDVVLDPFGGSGTTGAAALASGRRAILVERDPRFAEIARQRCAHWGAEWSALAKVSQRKARAAKGDEAQPSLFDDGAR